MSREALALSPSCAGGRVNSNDSCFAVWSRAKRCRSVSPRCRKEALMARQGAAVATNIDQPSTRWIPEGTFLMGSEKLLPGRAPQHQAHIDGFWIDRYVVTVGEFAAFVEETGYVTLAERPLDPRTVAEKSCSHGAVRKTAEVSGRLSWRRPRPVAPGRARPQRHDVPQLRAREPSGCGTAGPVGGAASTRDQGWLPSLRAKGRYEYQDSYRPSLRVAGWCY